jgi:5-methylcytosine-specific restriction endonuclease McrA
VKAAALLLLAVFAVEARDPGAVREFRKQHPCPATQKHRGACPGWQVDHVIPLKCGGLDSPANMQWLAVDDHRRKTAREEKHCIKRRAK